MAGIARLESLSASSSEPGFTGPYSNGKRASSLDRSGSFREGVESRVFSSGYAVSRGGGNVTVASSENLPLSQCLSLDPISIGDRKIDRSVELKRVMGLFVGSASEENYSGAAVSGHSKPSTPVAAAEDLKRLRSSIVDTCTTARGRASKLDEHLHKLDKYCDGVVLKKTQRNELTNNDQAGSLNSKIGTHIYKKPTEIVNQRVEDRPKNVLLNKRVRTSVAETRQGELRGNGIKRQPVTMAKDRDLLKDSVGEAEMQEEKIQRLPAGGEGWDKKMKRKRSVGIVFTRPMDSNGEPKRTSQNKVVSEPGLQPKDALPYRLGASNGTGSSNKSDNKLEGPSLPNSSQPRFSPRNELEGSTRDLAAGSNKETVLTKGNIKLNSHDDNHIAGGSLVTKGKASRSPRIGAMVAASSSPSTHRQSGIPETCENATAGATNRKRAMPSSSTSPSMAQWVGQRPQKMSRTRRANLVSPVSNQEEKPLSSDSCSHSDVNVRMASDGTNGPIITKQFKPKLEPVESPHRLSESEESVGGQNESQNIGPSLAIGMKVKSVVNEENCEGVRKQWRSGRGPSIARTSSTLTGEHLDNITVVNPIQTNRPGCEKNGSKSGRPLKKLSDRKGFSRLGHLHNSGSESTTTGNDDREELLAAANYARNASYLACSSAFWKKMEPIFAPVSSKDQFFLSAQLKEQDVHESFPQLPGRENNLVMNIAREGSVTVYDTNASGERNGHVKHQGSDSFSGRLDSDKTPKELIPLFQRVISALIIEDTIDELEQQEEDTGNIPLQDVFCDLAYDPNHLVDYESRKKVRREVEHDGVLQSVHSMKVSFSSNGCANAFRNSSFNDSPCDEVMLAGISKNSLNRPQVIQMDGFGISSFDSQYEHMLTDDKILLELHSIGVYPELVPNMDDKKDEAIKQEINELKIRLRQQNYKKKACLEKICKGVGSSSVRRDLEQLALDRLVELAYRKLLATRGGSRSAISKIPKHVALAFGKRTLARCRKFGKTGISCFNVPSLRDVLFAPRDIELEPTASVGGPAANTITKYIGFQKPHPGSRMSSDEAFARNGPISNRGKKKELLLDDVGTTGKRAYQGERKTKLKPKQKAGQPPIPGNGFVNQSTRTLHPVQPSLYGPNHNGSDTRRDIRTVSHSNGPRDISNEGQETMDPLHDLDPIDELGVGPELGGPQDLSSLLNFDVEELQDHYSAGLEIPMDDLTELNMF